MNKVVSGDYQGWRITCGRRNVKFSSLTKHIIFTKYDVAAFDTISIDTRKSASSVFARGLIGKWLFGENGMIAGGLSAKNKQTVTATIEFTNGRRSLIEVNGKIYKKLTRVLFR